MHCNANDCFIGTKNTAKRRTERKPNAVYKEV